MRKTKKLPIFTCRGEIEVPRCLKPFQDEKRVRPSWGIHLGTQMLLVLGYDCTEVDRAQRVGCLLVDEYEQRGEVVRIAEAMEVICIVLYELSFAWFSVESWGVELRIWSKIQTDWHPNPITSNGWSRESRKKFRNFASEQLWVFDIHRWVSWSGCILGWGPPNVTIYNRYSLPWFFYFFAWIWSWTVWLIKKIERKEVYEVSLSTNWDDACKSIKSWTGRILM